MQPPRLRVDHVSVAVRSFDRALDFFLEHFPAVLGEPRQPGYDGDFFWGDVTIGRFKIEAALAPLERAGVRVVDRLELRPGWRTAVLHPRSCFGVLVRLRQIPTERWDPEPSDSATGSARSS